MPMHRTRYLAPLLLLLALLLSPSALAAPYKNPPVYSGMAEDYMGYALAENFGEEWELRITERPVKCKKVAYSRARCKIGWAYGDVAIWGKGRLWTHAHGSEWSYAYNLIRLDEYCYYVQHNSWKSCTDRIRVR